MLADTQIKKALPKRNPYKLYDGQGLLVLVQPTGAKYWRAKYRIRQGEKLIEKTLALGVYPRIKPAEARDQLHVAKKDLAAQKDPAVEKKETKNLTKLCQQQHVWCYRRKMVRTKIRIL